MGVNYRLLTTSSLFRYGARLVHGRDTEWLSGSNAWLKNSHDTNDLFFMLVLVYHAGGTPKNRRERLEFSTNSSSSGPQVQLLAKEARNVDSSLSVLLGTVLFTPIVNHATGWGFCDLGACLLVSG